MINCSFNVYKINIMMYCFKMLIVDLRKVCLIVESANNSQSWSSIV